MVVRLDEADVKTMRDTVDKYKDKLENAVIVLASVYNGKVLLAVGVTKNNTDFIKAGELISWLAPQVGGKGGGRPDFAQAGGRDPSKLDEALDAIPNWVAKQIN